MPEEAGKNDLFQNQTEFNIQTKTFQSLGLVFYDNFFMVKSSILKNYFFNQHGPSYKERVSASILKFY